jgi:hypothetical protein
MPRKPFTVAIRVMHLGRYGADAGDARLLPLVWTVRDIVRGYGDLGVGPSSLGSLSASRMLVGNAEIRFPLLDLLTHSSHPNALPIEGLVFSDLGRFWMPDRFNSQSSLLRSVGAGARSSTPCAVLMRLADGRFPSTCARASNALRRTT